MTTPRQYSVIAIKGYKTDFSGATFTRLIDAGKSFKIGIETMISEFSIKVRVNKTVNIFMNQTGMLARLLKQ
ncbi:hypothetical protein [Latilactobacillus fuchuensis]|uniref:hypothetical protein n=1 Tax=Latilactobacillus fuchuensis TaxID=164393 RepID=UPI000469D427|nr:hypothetical protein [Latilactobacillus fuchuensis]